MALSCIIRNYIRNSVGFLTRFFKKDSDGLEYDLCRTVTVDTQHYQNPCTQQIQYEKVWVAS